MPEPTEAWTVYICAKCHKPVGQHDGLTCTSVPTWIAVEMMAVSPGCRGAELAEAAERIDACYDPDTASFVAPAVADFIRLHEALAAFRASGEAGPEKERRAN